MPIDGGGRLTGRVGRFSVGVVNIQTGDEHAGGAPATNFSVVRVKRDILRRSSVGAIATRPHRSAQSGTGANRRTASTARSRSSTTWPSTPTGRGRGPTGVNGDDTSYRAQLDYAGDRYGLQLERLVVGDNFNPEVGFVRRDDMRRNFGQFRFSPRPRAIKVVRKYLVESASIDYIENGGGRLETRDVNRRVRHRVSEQRSVHARLRRTPTSSSRGRFRIAPGVTLPVGGYDLRQRPDRIQLRPAAASCRATFSPNTAPSTTATGRRSA